VDYGHVDLAGKIDAGHNFIACPDTNIPCPFLPQDDFGHGTHVAGIAAASTNNGAGIAGVSWGARIMPLKVLNSSGSGTFENVAAAIVWAVDHGAQVINLSLGGSAYSAGLENAVLYAYGNNVLMAASSGNTGSNFVLYPARFPQVIAVGASNMSNQPASFSNYGPEVDLAAPGDFIYSTLPGGYGFRTGTSMSAPHVSGLASILFGYVTSADSVRGIIESTALDIGPVGWDDYSGAGLIQMDAAIALVVPSLSTPTSTESGGGSFNPPGFLPFPGYSLPTGTFTPLPSLAPFDTAQGKPATPTPTVSPPGEKTPTPTPTPTQIPVKENKINRLKIFLSPVFCGAVFMILLGIWLFWRARKNVHNKFVMRF
jgi:subtilisin family serine protease